MKKNDLLYIKHIIDAITNINKFIKNKSFNDFNNDILISSAVIRMFEIIGEASNNISQETKNEYPDIPWRIIKDTRNYLIHQYFGVDNKVIWDTIQIDLPALKKEFDRIIKEFES